MNIRQRCDLAYDIWYAINGIPWTGSEQEPDYVAKLVATLTGVIKRSLTVVMPGRRISVGGAFIHQKPTFIASIMSVNEGRTFQATSPRDDWSQMILDLLQLAATSVFNRRNSGFVREKRWNGPDAFDFILNLGQAGSDDDGQGSAHNSEERDCGCGVSLICVDLGDGE